MFQLENLEVWFQYSDGLSHPPWEKLLPCHSLDRGSLGGLILTQTRLRPSGCWGQIFYTSSHTSLAKSPMTYKQPEVLLSSSFYRKPCCFYYIGHHKVDQTYDCISHFVCGFHPPIPYGQGRALLQPQGKKKLKKIIYIYYNSRH